MSGGSRWKGYCRLHGLITGLSSVVQIDPLGSQLCGQKSVDGMESETRRRQGVLSKSVGALSSHAQPDHASLGAIFHKASRAFASTPTAS